MLRRELSVAAIAAKRRNKDQPRLLIDSWLILKPWV
jgi:hypothetical protein